MEMQSVDSQKGEILFRRKLVQQQVHGQSQFTDELSADEIERLLRARMAHTHRHMAALQRSGACLSPYLEIGAERGQRSLVMENDVGACGAAIDLSFDMLQSCAHYGNIFGKKKLPLRVCCDANRLPFRDGSIPFVFCYETLHHFPEPGPVLREVWRVLAPGGWFLLDEEPCRKLLHFKVYQRQKIYSREFRQRSLFLRAFDSLFSRMNCNEVEHGIIENHSIPLSTWWSALAPFADRRINLLPKVPEFLRRRLDDEFTVLNAPPSRVKHAFKVVLAWLFGGVISGVCRKPGELGRPVRLEDAFTCPNCRDAGNEASLARGESRFVCSACACAYPVLDGVVFLFTRSKLQELYPDLAARASRQAS